MWVPTCIQWYFYKWKNLLLTGLFYLIINFLFFRARSKKEAVNILWSCGAGYLVHVFSYSVFAPWICSGPGMYFIWIKKAESRWTVALLEQFPWLYKAGKLSDIIFYTIVPTNLDFKNYNKISESANFYSPIRIETCMSVSSNFHPCMYCKIMAAVGKLDCHIVMYLHVRDWYTSLSLNW